MSLIDTVQCALVSLSFFLFYFIYEWKLFMDFASLPLTDSLGGISQQHGRLNDCIISLFPSFFYVIS